MTETHTHPHIKPLESLATSISVVDPGKATLNIQEIKCIPNGTPLPEESSTVLPCSGFMEQPAPVVQGFHQLECYEVVVAGVSFTPIKFD
jgi:hypothetical protein